jgi:uncharacterized membrane protein
MTIEAPADAIWRLTIDVPNLPSLTPTMRAVERLDDGPLRIGSRTRIKQPVQTPAVWTVTCFEPGSEFVWETRRLWMRMVGTHRVEDLGERCRNTLIIELTGPGSGVLGAIIGSAVGKAIGVENAGFKAAAEGKANG